jgi:hypothetical protein
MSGFPSHLGISSDLRLLIVVPAVADVEVGFEFRYREMLPLLGLSQKGPALRGTECRRLTVQRSYCTISAHVLDYDFPTPDHELIPPSCVKVIATMRQKDFRSG